MLCTLLINAPLMPWLLKKTGLLAKPSGKLFARGKAARALLRYSEAAVSDLQNNEDEMLSGEDTLLSFLIFLQLPVWIKGGVRGCNQLRFYQGCALRAR